jgi:hypothetical protein
MRTNASRLAAAIILTTLGSGCAPEIRYVTAPLPLPERPVLPRLTAEEMACLRPEVYERWVRRDLGRRQYCETLETIIRRTHGSP